MSTDPGQELQLTPEVMGIIKNKLIPVAEELWNGRSAMVVVPNHDLSRALIQPDNPIVKNAVLDIVNAWGGRLDR